MHIYYNIRTLTVNFKRFDINRAENTSPTLLEFKPKVFSLRYCSRLTSTCSVNIENKKHEN